VPLEEATTGSTTSGMDGKRREPLQGCADGAHPGQEAGLYGGDGGSPPRADSTCARISSSGIAFHFEMPFVSCAVDRGHRGERVAADGPDRPLVRLDPGATAAVRSPRS